MSDDELPGPGNYGLPLKHDPEFRGPCKRRSCTDIICLFLFTGFVVGWGFVGLFAFKRGDPGKVLRPTDSEGRRCGLDSEVLSKPNLLFFDISKCADPTVILNGCNTPQVCVEQCPDHSWSSSPYLNGELRFDANEIRKNLICTKEYLKNSVNNINELRDVIDKNLCAPWYTTSQSIYRRCLPFQSNKASDVSWKKLHQGIVEVLISIRESISSYNHGYTFAEVGVEIIHDLSSTWKIILLTFGMTIIFNLLYISLLRWFAGILTWLSIAGIFSLSVTGAIFSFQRYKYLEKNGPPLVKNKMLIGILEEWSYSPTFWIILTVFLACVAAIIFLLSVFLRKRIVIAITLIKEGSKAVSCIMTSLFFPIIPWILQFIVVIWVLVVLCYLNSIGKDTFIVRNLDNNICVCSGEYETLKSGDTCDPILFKALCNVPQTNKECTSAGCHFLKQEKENLVTYFEIFNIFGFFWGIWFVSGLSEMILAGAFASWYWTYNKQDVPFFTITASFGRVLRYHLGTIAFGSLLLATCSFIRAAIEYAEKKIKKFDNAFTKAILCCCRCFFWCLEKFLRFLNHNAYIMCAIHGKNFCSSAGKAFNLLMRNVIRVVVLDKVTDFVFFIGKLVITGCMVTASYYLFIKNTNAVLHYNGAAPLIVIAIGCYIIASIFFGVYQMAVDTLFLCFLEDCERNDGSPEKPYFMSKELMKILGKRNKKLTR